MLIYQYLTCEKSLSMAVEDSSMSCLYLEVQKAEMSLKSRMYPRDTSLWSHNLPKEFNRLKTKYSNAYVVSFHN